MELRRSSLAWLCAALALGCAAPPGDVPPSSTPTAEATAPASPRGSAAGVAAAEPPNVVFIIADDLGFPYHGFLGNPIVHTPNLDRLARGGTVFTTGYVTASVCEPSLRTLLLGEEPFPRSDHQPGRPSGRPAQRSLPGLLAARGYASFQAGKLWNRSYARAGFSEGSKAEGELAGTPLERWMGGAKGLEIGRTTMEPVFDFLARHRDQPFFLWFAPELPHRPWNAPSKYLRLYRRAHPELSAATVAYFANITRFDDAVGALLDDLDRTGLRARTLIVYVNDNGYGPTPEEGGPIEAWKGAKGTTTELGFRTPIIFNWPGHVPAGVVRDDLVSSLDLFPTALDLAGVESPSGLAGIDLRPTLAGGPGPRSEIIGRMANVRLVDPQHPPPTDKTTAYFLRNDRWHYVWSPDRDTELLFDVVADPRERVNRAADRPDVARDLRGRIEAWRETPPGPFAASLPDLVSDELWRASNRGRIPFREDGYFAFPDGTRRVVVDVGAYKLKRTKHFLWETSDVAILGVEPMSEPWSSWPKNPRVLGVPAAVSLERGSLRFNVNEVDVTSSLLDTTDESRLSSRTVEVRRVPGVRLEDILERIPPELEVVLLKTDVQGMDLAVLMSAGGQLRRVKEVQSEIINDPSYEKRGSGSMGNEREFRDYMAEMGFSVAKEIPAPNRWMVDVLYRNDSWPPGPPADEGQKFRPRGF